MERSSWCWWQTSDTASDELSQDAGGSQQSGKGEIQRPQKERIGWDTWLNCFFSYCSCFFHFFFFNFFKLVFFPATNSMFCLKFFGFFDLLYWFVFSLGPEHHLLLVVAVRRYRLLPRRRHHRNIQNPRWLFRDTKIVSFLKYFLCISFSIPFMWFQLSCTQYFELIALNWPFKDVSLVSEELAWFPVLEPVLHRLHLDPLQQQPKNAPGLRDLVDADPPERRFEIFFFFFTCCPYVFFHCFSLFPSFIFFATSTSRFLRWTRRQGLQASWRNWRRSRNARRKNWSWWKSVRRINMPKQHLDISRYVLLLFFFLQFILFSNCLFFPFLLSVNAWDFWSLSLRSSKRIWRSSKTSLWKWIPWSNSWPTIWKNWSRRRKSVTISWRPWNHPGQFFLFFFNIFQKTRFWQSKFHQSFDETLIVSIKVLSKLWLNFDSAIKV